MAQCYGAQQKDYYIGQIMSMSLVHGGLTPSLFAEPVVDYIIHGIDKARVRISDLQDGEIKRRVQKVCT